MNQRTPVPCREFIIRACDSHDDLLEACKAAKRVLTFHPSCRMEVTLLRSAIAKAGGASITPYYAHDDLLKACQKIVAAFEQPHHWADSIAKQMGIVRAAIAKATSPPEK